jgi:uncharacterized repeat protein (TIGR01451 family)
MQNQPTPVAPRTRVFLLALLIGLLVIGFFESGHRASSQSRRAETGRADGIVESPAAAGTITVRVVSNLAGIIPTDTASIRKRVFTGSTSCTTGGGPTIDVPNVNSGAGHVITLTAADSVLLQTFPYSDRNGGIQGLQFPDGNSVDFLPANSYCVHGFDNTNHNANIVVTTAVQTLAFDTNTNTCTTTPKYLFNAGEKVCARVSGSGGTVATPWKMFLFGGRNNSCSLFFSNQQVTAESQTFTFTLPANNAAIPAGCTAGGTTQITGDWQARVDDNTNNFKGAINFRLRDPANVNSDVQVYESLGSSIGQGTLPLGGGIIEWLSTIQTSGPDPAAGVQFVTNFPAGTTLMSMVQTSGPPFTCGAPVGQNITCTANGPLLPGTYPNFRMLVSYGAQPANTVFAHNVSVFSGTTDPFPTNNTASAPAQLPAQNFPHQCQLQKADMVVNSTSAAGANVVYSNPTSTGASCTGTIQCSPASNTVFPIGLNVVGCNIINQDGAGGGQFNVTVLDAQRPDLQILKTPYGSFFQGQEGLYVLSVKNIGLLATNGTTVTVTEQPPPGVSIVSMSGSGWTCDLNTFTCTRSNALASNGTYPPIIVKVSFPIYWLNTNSYANTATVAGGGDGTPTNNTANSLVQILPLGTGLAPTAGGVTVEGRVEGLGTRGLTNARVTLSDPAGVSQTVVTGRRGTFRFEDVETGRTYIVTV